MIILLNNTIVCVMIQRRALLSPHEFYTYSASANLELDLKILKIESQQASQRFEMMDQHHQYLQQLIFSYYFRYQHFKILHL